MEQKSDQNVLAKEFRSDEEIARSDENRLLEAVKIRQESDQNVL
jgi:hypothetical protein